MSVISKIQDIINKNYKLSDLEEFAKLYCKDNTYEEESVLRDFKYIESVEEYPISILRLQEIKAKVSVKTLEKTFNLEKHEHHKKHEVEFFTYDFYKRFLATSCITDYVNLCNLELIFTVDMLKRNTTSSKTKQRILSTGYILHYEEKTEEGKLQILEFVKHKNNKDEFTTPHDILIKFEYDSDVDKVKPFNETIKQYFSKSLESIDDEENIKANQKKLEISKMVHLPKEERITMEKDVKVVKATARTYKIQIKATKISFLLHDKFILEDIKKLINMNLLEFSSIVVFDHLKQPKEDKTFANDEEDTSEDKVVNNEEDNASDNEEDNASDDEEDNASDNEEDNASDDEFLDGL